ncbi:MAG TPA: hypothetical protein VHE13_10750 [Opitutus sp.]|nr:hypothetical protein [Opitutus sp.]
MSRPKNLSAKFILRGQALGFSTLLIIMWTLEALGVPARFFGDSPDHVWTRVLLRSGVLIAIWLIVHLTTRRLLRRLHELEDFLVVCSWCRRVGHEGQWLSMEEYFGSKFNTETSHGICPDCARRQLAAPPRAERVEHVG